jgi:hypothetical protein
VLLFGQLQTYARPPSLNHMRVSKDSLWALHYSLRCHLPYRGRQLTMTHSIHACMNGHMCYLRACRRLNLVYGSYRNTSCTVINPDISWGGGREFPPQKNFQSPKFFWQGLEFVVTLTFSPQRPNFPPEGQGVYRLNSASSNYVGMYIEHHSCSAVNAR